MESLYAYRFVKFVKWGNINAIYKFNVIPFKIPTQLFTNLERTIFNFIWKNNKSRISKTMVYNKSISGCITISDFNQSKKRYSLKKKKKTSWYCHKNRQGYQWNWIKDPDINTLINRHLSFDKNARNSREKEKLSSTNGTVLIFRYKQIYYPAQS